MKTRIYQFFRIFFLGVGISSFSFCSKPFPSSDFLLLLGLAIPGQYLFVTSSSYSGDLGGIAGADLKCQSAKLTDGSDLPGLPLEYQALLAGPGRAPGGAGWPLSANTSYFAMTPASTLVFHTTSGALPVIPMDSGIPGSSLNYWTGLDGALAAGANCNGWMDSTVAFDAEYGVSGDTSIGAFNQGFANPCDTPNMRLLCVRN